MKALELIRHRRSVRTFDGRPLEEEDAGKILAFAQETKNPYGIEIVWMILSEKQDKLSTTVISGADTFITGKVKRVPHAEEAFGYSFERIVLYAESLGIGTTWIAGTMDRKAFEKAAGLEAGEVMPCVSPLGYPAKKMSLRETLMRKGVKADSRLEAGQIFYRGSFDSPLPPTEAGEFSDLLEMVRWAPSAVNKQPWRLVLDSDKGMVHFYEKKNKGFIDESGWDLQKIDIGIALCHLVYGLEEAGKSAELILEDPGISAPSYTEYVATIRIK